MKVENSYHVYSCIKLDKETFQFIYSSTESGYSYTFLHEVDLNITRKVFNSRIELEDYVETNHPNLSEHLEWDAQTEVFSYYNRKDIK